MESENKIGKPSNSSSMKNRKDLAKSQLRRLLAKLPVTAVSDPTPTLFETKPPSSAMTPEQLREQIKRLARMKTMP